MNLFPVVLILCTVLCGTFSGCTEDDHEMHSGGVENTSLIVITDHLNNTITFSHPVQRIVTTSTYATEYLVVVGADEEIVGVSSYIKENPLFNGYLSNARIIGTEGTPDLETIVSLNPDVVLLPAETSEETRAKFRNSQLKVLFFSYYSLAALPDTVRAIGSMTGNDDRAGEYLRFYEKYNKTIDQRLRTISPDNESRVYYEMSGDYSTSGKGSGGYNYLLKLRAENSAEQFSVSYPIVSPEWLIAEDPDVIIKLCDQAHPGNLLREEYDSLVTRPEFANITAGKTNRTYTISTNILYGPRVITGLLTLAKVFYPEKFPDIKPDSVLDEYSGSFFPNANNTEMIYPKI